MTFGFRRSREAVLMDTAHVFASRSTCTRAQVGAVIARDGRIIVTGYNGAPSGVPHCDHTCTCPPLVGNAPERECAADRLSIHRDWCPADSPCDTATHAEANAVAFAARHGVATEGAQLYVTMAPCLACARIVINAGLSTVYYDHPYRNMSGVLLLTSVGVIVHGTDGGYLR